MEETEKTQKESMFRINIKTTSKGEPYWDATAKGDTAFEIDSNLNLVVSVAQNKCNEIRAKLPKEEPKPSIKKGGVTFVPCNKEE